MRFTGCLLSGLVAVTFALSLTACDNPQQKEARYIKRGNQLLENGEAEKARVEYKNAAHLNPTDAEPFYRIGLVDESEGDLRNAFANFTTAEQQNSHFHPATLKIAQYMMEAEHDDEARQRLRTVLQEEPDNAEAHALNAALLLREKKLDAAEKEARTALGKDPANVSAYAALTGIYAAGNHADQAIATVNDGIARNPKNLALLMLRALLYVNSNDLPKIDEAYQALFKLKPEEAQFRVDLANIYAKAGKLEEAEASLRAGIASRPDDWNLKYRLVMFLNDQRGLEAAEAEIRAITAANPKNDDPYFWLASLYASHDATDKAAALLNQIVERGQSDASTLNADTLLARLQWKHGNRALADQLVAAVLAKAPNNRDALLIRASLAFENGDYQSTVSDARAILRDKPSDEAALQVMGETLFLQGHINLAIDTMKRLADLNPANSAARVRLAQMIDASGDKKQAMETITRVTASDPAYPVGWETAARLAIDAKEWLVAEEAVRNLNKIDGQQLTASFLEGQILDKSGSSDKAVEHYTDIIKADPASPLAEHAMTALLIADNKLGHIEAAAHLLQSLPVSTPFAKTMLGKCYAMMGKPDQAAAIYDQALQSRPALADLYLDRAHLYIEAQQPEQAIAVLQQGNTAVPGDTRAGMAEANLLMEAGRYQDAIALYRAMLSRNAALDVAANNLAELIADYQFDDSAALEQARQIAERFSGSNNPALLDTLAWVYFRQGNLPLAETVMQRAMAHGDSLPAQMHYHYGAILMKSGKAGQARSEFLKALQPGAPYPGLEDARKMMQSQ